LKRAGCKKIFTDKATGVHVKRPELAQCLKALKAGDVLIVWKLDRLTRRTYRALGDIMDQKGDVGQTIRDYRRSLQIFAELAKTAPVE